MQATRFNDASSDFDVLVASDAIGMGLNLNISRIIFSTMKKFDGTEKRELTVSEIKQIAGTSLVKTLVNFYYIYLVFFVSFSMINLKSRVVCGWTIGSKLDTQILVLLHYKLVNGLIMMFYKFNIYIFERFVISSLVCIPWERTRIWYGYKVYLGWSVFIMHQPPWPRKSNFSFVEQTCVLCLNLDRP